MELWVWIHKTNDIYEIGHQVRYADPHSLIEVTDCEVAKGMCDFVDRAIEKDVSQRYQSASAMAEDLSKSTRSVPCVVLRRPCVTEWLWL